MVRESELTISLQDELSSGGQENAVEFPCTTQTALALDDILDGLTSWRTWMLLAYQDIKLRYRRSTLGPFWITLSMAITVYSMGFLYAHLFHVNMNEYYPFLVGGMLTWSLISTVITDLTETFTQSESLIKQIKLPYSLYIHRVTMRNMLIFFHNVLVIIPIYFIFHDTAKVNFNTLLCLVGLAIIYVNAVIYGLILAMIGSRFRDVMQIIKSLIQVVFFVTPVMWTPATLPQRAQSFMILNPFYSFLEIVRAPLIGAMPTLNNYLVTLGVTLFGALICAKLFIPYRSRIIYWL